MKRGGVVARALVRNQESFGAREALLELRRHWRLFPNPRSPWFGPASFRAISSSPAIRGHQSWPPATVRGGRVFEPGFIFGSQAPPPPTSVEAVGLGLAAHGLYRRRSSWRDLACLRGCALPPLSQSERPCRADH